VVTVDAVRKLALSLPRSYEVLVRDRVKFRVGRIVYLALSQDEKAMGFAFPKDERQGLVESDPDRFFLPVPSDLRFNWVRVWLHTIDDEELYDLVVDAWRMVVPQFVYADWSAL
jgi:hypothetical protein